MITLYHAFNARSFRPLWALEALGLDYQLNMLPFPPRVLARDYLAINPLGTIPCLIEDGLRMTESAAIAQYLADRHGAGGLGVAPHEPDYGAYLNWLHFGEATLTFPQTLVLRYRRFEPDRAAVAADDYAKWFLARARAVGPALDQGYICAGRFTAADISMGYAFMLAHHVGLGDDLPEPAKAYWRRLQDEPSLALARAAQTRAAEAQGVAASW
ncbi:glutathione S-transferase family protein [Caulobacter sp. KR2-114]|uniref:glutathione S-transferase family protein n=1 Tax=Caulobacter sp. KR2-114 TaxID=3400912 RepID=UPI003BFF62E1